MTVSSCLVWRGFSFSNSRDVVQCKIAGNDMCLAPDQAKEAGMVPVALFVTHVFVFRFFAL